MGIPCEIALSECYKTSLMRSCVHEKPSAHQTLLMILQNVWWFVQNHQTYCLIMWNTFHKYLTEISDDLSKCLMICSKSSDIVWWSEKTFRKHWIEKSTLVQLKALCHQATSHYINQYSLRSVSPFGITRPEWVNDGMEPDHHLFNGAKPLPEPMLPFYQRPHEQTS